MSKFNSIDYLTDQIQKQYDGEVKTKNKNVLNYDFFYEKLSSFSKEKFKKIHILVHGNSIENIQKFVKNKDFTYEDLVLYYIKKIKEEDERLNSVLFLNPMALKEAKEKSYNKKNHLLYGIPILVKGNIGIKGLPLTAGAISLENNIARRDSAIVKKLKDKGAIVLGQTNLSELANYMTSNSSNGYSAIGGQTKNPYGYFDVGGSSSGSAVAVAMGFAAAALGTETAGSIIYPASQNGVVGLKPTLGLVSQDMIVPISKTHDTAGPMTNNPKDLWILLNAISELEIKECTFTPNNLSNTKIGIIMNEEIINTLRDSDNLFLEKMKVEFSNKGATIEEVILDSKIFDYDISDVLAFEFREEINNFLKKHFADTKVNSLEKIIELNKIDLDNNAPYGQDLLKESLDSKYNKESIGDLIHDYQKGSSEVFEKIFAKYDFLLSISNYMTTPYACSGNPAINFPIGTRDSGEPIGGTLIGNKNSEVALIEAVHAYLN